MNSDGGVTTVTRCHQTVSAVTVQEGCHHCHQSPLRSRALSGDTPTGSGDTFERPYIAIRWRYSGGVILWFVVPMALAGGYLVWLTRRTHHG